MLSTDIFKINGHSDGNDAPSLPTSFTEHCTTCMADQGK